jgi:hypothetical protein
VENKRLKEEIKALKLKDRVGNFEDVKKPVIRKQN